VNSKKDCIATMCWQLFTSNLSVVDVMTVNVMGTRQCGGYKFFWRGPSLL